MVTNINKAVKKCVKKDKKKNNQILKSTNYWFGAEFPWNSLSGLGYSILY